MSIGMNIALLGLTLTLMCITLCTILSSIKDQLKRIADVLEAQNKEKEL